MRSRLAAEGADIIASGHLRHVRPVTGRGCDGRRPRRNREPGQEPRAPHRHRRGRRRDFSALAAAVDSGVEQLGRLDIIAANAGIGTTGVKLDRMDEDLWQEMIDVNLSGVWKTVKAGVPPICSRAGAAARSILTSSVAGSKAYPFTGALRRGQTRRRRAHAQLCRGVGPALDPGEFGTSDPRQQPDADERDDLPHVPARIWRTPDRRISPRSARPSTCLPIPWVTPEDISNAVLFLASDEARYITGSPCPSTPAAALEMHTRLLRPVRRRHRRRPVPGVRPRCATRPRSTTTSATTSGRCPGTPTWRRRCRTGKPSPTAEVTFLELVKSDFDMPPGVMMFEDPPMHTHAARVDVAGVHAAPDGRDRRSDPAVLRPLPGPARRLRTGSTSSPNWQSMMPMRVIGMLLGIPESEQIGVRDANDANLRTKPGTPMKVAQADRIADGRIYADYVEWRANNLVRRPDDGAAQRRVHRRVRGHPQARAQRGAALHRRWWPARGNETTGRLIGWLAKVLAEHPDQRREVVQDRSLLTRAVDETLRFEPTGPHVARWVARDFEYDGTTVPAGSAMLSAVRRGQPRPASLPQPRHVRHPSRHLQPPHLRQGVALLPRRQPGPAGGPCRARRTAQPVPRMGDRLRQCETGAHLDGMWLGETAPSGEPSTVNTDLLDRPGAASVVRCRTARALSHGLREHRLTDDIADREDVRHVRAHLLVDVDKAAVRYRHARLVRADLLAIRRAADRHQHQVVALGFGRSLSPSNDT